MLRFVRPIVVVALVGGLVAVTGQTANAEAECAQLDPWPSFTEAAPSAKTVFVGTVTEMYPGNEARFTFRVDEVLRGNPPSVIEVDGFKSAIRLKEICPTGSVLMVRKAGERLAFAMDGRLDGMPGRIDAVAFVGDSKPRRSLLLEMERLPLQKVRRLAGQAPDGSTSSLPRHADGPMSRATLKREAPGVWRVTDDWTGRNVDRVRLVEAGPDGTIWLAGTLLLSRLGYPGTIRKPKSLLHVRDLASTTDGDLLVTGEYAATFDGQAWTKLIGDPQDRWRRRTHVTFVSDGSAWAGTDQWASHEYPGFAHWDGVSWTITDHPCDCPTSGFAEDANGDLWMGVWGWNVSEDYDGVGLFRLDDGTWHEVRPLDEPERVQVYGMTAGPDGTMWVSPLPGSPDRQPLGDYSESYLARWDGTSWIAYSWPSWARRTLERINPYQDGFGGSRAFFGPDMTVSPDGTLWFERPLMSFDGQTWRSYTVPTYDELGPRTSDLTIDPDGMVWLSVRDFTYLEPGRPHRLFVLDPAEVVPTATEDAVLVTPDAQAGTQ